MFSLTEALRHKKYIQTITQDYANPCLNRWLLSSLKKRENIIERRDFEMNFVH